MQKKTLQIIKTPVLVIGVLFLFILIGIGYTKFNEISEYQPVKYGDFNDTYYIHAVTPFPEGDLGYVLYKKVNLFTFENLGSSYRLYTTTDSGYKVIDPQSPDTVISIHSYTGNDIFYYKPATHELISPENFHNFKLTCCTTTG